MNSIDFLAQFGIFSKERCQLASKSEIRRWLDAGSVWANGERLEIEPMDFPLISLVLFPKGRRITLL